MKNRTVSTEEWMWFRVVLPDRNLKNAIQHILAEKKTGSLTVHFGQGGISSMEWQQSGVLHCNDWPFEKAPLNGK